MRMENTLKVGRAYLSSLPSTNSRTTNTLAPTFSIGIEQRSYTQLPNPGKKEELCSGPSDKLRYNRFLKWVHHHRRRRMARISDTTTRRFGQGGS